MVDLSLDVRPPQAVFWIGGATCRAWWRQVGLVAPAPPDLGVRLGRAGTARVVFADPLAVLLAADGATPRPAGSGPQVFVGLPHLERAREMLAALAWLGVARVVPVLSARASRASADPARLEALRGTGSVPVDDPVDLPTAIGAAPLWLDPRGTHDLAAAAPAGVQAVLVGPEGGFTPAEQARLEAAGLARRGLGPDILRTQTAVVTAVARLVLGPPQVPRAGV